MESSQQLLSDSSSYRWLIACLNDSDLSAAAVGCSFIELDPAFLSLRCTIDDFNFDLPLASHCSVPVHGDKMIFSSGRLLPPAISNASIPPSSHKVGSSSSASSSPLFHTARSSPSWTSSCSSCNHASRRGATGFSSPKKILRKYLFFLMPLFKTVQEFKQHNSKKSVRRCKDSARSSPRTSNALSSIEWCRSNADISIYDAILHCKKSFGQDS
ncbi:hypothetical protein Cni_G16225 [Canna indica]|uniref:Membrane-associated kinase regulator 6 n=1 Tax=Canna indica TaxID=4628 RepID=A0AAQ3QFP5_9LILI|nr:hypothetical protein Cni_G16225 [Canna indica]